MVYPNPAKEKIQFTWDGNQLYPNLNIYDLKGNLVLQQQITKGSPVSIDRLSKGMYFYKLIDSGSQINTGKIFVK